ncbi:MAG TPA: DUF4148 domain-containing protein [Albitalea sp.]|nr:DUF4148 domain-containing protein [Albitalea sp.]
MNAKQLIAVSVLAVAGSAAFAQDITVFPDTPSVASREQVKAELARAIADHNVPALGDLTTVPAEPQVASRLREDVRAEARAYARSHRANDIGA